ncbi:Carboxypeptidase A4 [Chytriomyces hyalinus]|nr:Carboxypeptidase A4 [Chytriomyces hyalinus]
MKLVAFLTLAVTAATCVLASDSRYAGDQVIRFEVGSLEDQATLQKALDSSALGLDLWSHSGNKVGNIDVRVPASSVPQLSNIGVAYKVLVQDLQQVVDAERDHMGKNSEVLHNSLMAGEPVQLTAATIFNDWQSYETLSAYIAGLPGVTQLPSIGKTYQGRDTNVYKFGTGPYGVVYHGGIHAREWISPATAAYITTQLVNNTDLLSKFTFYVMPVVNPDGYAYTRAANGDRYHRKNMQPNAGSTCIGTDPNRNFDIGWSGPGASGSACSETYYGPSAFSTPESTNIANFVKNTPNVVGYVDLHSYSELFMFANGYTCSGQVSDYATLFKGAELAVAAIKATSGHSFKYGDICNTIYQASGGSVDYIYNKLGVKYSYTIELRPNSSGTGGFNPPVSEIIPSGQETTAAFVAVWNYVYSQLSGTTPVPTTTSKAAGSPTLPITTITTTKSPTPKPTPASTITDGGCVHNVCATGGKLKASCSACARAVCAKDSYCCNTSWDSTCVREVAQYCSNVTC